MHVLHVQANSPGLPPNSFSHASILMNSFEYQFWHDDQDHENFVGAGTALSALL